MKTLFSFLFLLMFHAALNQTSISGVVKDVSGESVPGANVFVENSYDGASTDVNGKFQFTTEESGEHNIIVTFVGYKTFKQTVSLTGKGIVLQVVLQQEASELKEVTISAGSFTASDASRRTVFKALDIATTAGATADIAGALNTLPGTQKVGESGRLFVRGGDGSETRTFIDGMVVLDAYGPAAPNTPSRGRFLPFMFKGTSFSTGGYSSEFGQALSSALVLDSRDEATLTKTDIGILSVGADIAHTQAWNRGSVAGKIQYTNLRPYVGLVDQEIDWRTAPAAVEGVAAFRHRVGKAGMFKLYGNFNDSDFSLYQHDIDHPEETTVFKLKNHYRYINGFYTQPINESWSVRGGMSYNFIGNDITLGNMLVDEKESGLHLKSVVEGSITDLIELKTGVEVIHRDNGQHFTNAPVDKLLFTETITAFFAETDVYTTKHFITRAGARLEHNSLQNKAGVDPRISFAYKAGKASQVSFAYGTFRQTPNNEWLRINAALQNEKATHFILNYQRIEENKTFRVEAFYKRYDDLVKFENGNRYALSNNGDGYAKGLELFWRDNTTVRNLDYWVSYSFIDTERNYLNFPHRAMPSFASSHNFSIVGKYFIRQVKSQVGATYSFASGRPYFNPNEERFHASRTRAYQDLSINWSYLPKPYIVLYLSCTNILGYDNIFGYEYSSTPTTDGAYNGRAIRQPAPRFLFIGVFITLSKDKTMNQLPSL